MCKYSEYKGIGYKRRLFLLSCCEEVFVVDVFFCVFVKYRSMGQSVSKQNVFNKVRDGNVEEVRSMLARGSDPNCRGEVSFPFHFPFTLLVCLLV